MPHDDSSIISRNNACDIANAADICTSISPIRMDNTKASPICASDAFAKLHVSVATAMSDIGISATDIPTVVSTLLPGEVLDDLECQNMRIISHPDLYRFTSDSVRLANLVRGKFATKMLDLCSGGGIIPLLVAAKTRIDCIVGVEIQPELTAMAVRSADINHLSHRIKFLNADINTLSSTFTAHSFDIITCNPPYYRVGSGESRLPISHAVARHEISVSIEQIISTAYQQLKYGGLLYIVHKCDRLAEVLSLLVSHRLQPKELYTYTPVAGRCCDTFIAVAKSNASSGMILRNIIIEN